MNKNQEVANRINEMKGLTERAREMIALTDINIFAEIFGGKSEDDLNEMAIEYYEEM